MGFCSFFIFIRLFDARLIEFNVIYSTTGRRPNMEMQGARAIPPCRMTHYWILLCAPAGFHHDGIRLRYQGDSV